MGGTCSTHGRFEWYRFVVGKWGSLSEADHCENLGVGGRIVKWIFKKRDEEALTGLIWLRIVIGDGRL